MKISSAVITSAIFLFANALLPATIHAAPKPVKATTAAKPKPKAKPTPKPKVTPRPAPKAPVIAAPDAEVPQEGEVDEQTVENPDVETGVLINAVTRNNKQSNAQFALAANGEALAPIVISEKASDSVKIAAADLKKYLDQMTGANFKIETGDGAKGIVLGSKSEFPTPALDDALEISNVFDGKEAYAIRTSTARILILGGTDLGASHGVYRLLEEMGCRWFFPNATANWEVIPSTPGLEFQRDVTDRPAFLYRGIWAGYGIFGDDHHPSATAAVPRSAVGDFADWARRNVQGKSFVVQAGHNLSNVVGVNRAEFEAHPEYFALSGGKRTGGPQLELGNPRVREMIIEWVRDYFTKNPDADMFSVDPADGYGASESPETVAYAGNASDAQFKMANEVAQMLQKEFPGKMVGMYAYNWHSDPPPFDLEPNVYIQLTMGFNAGKLSLDQLFEQWPLKARNLGFYDYYSVWRWDADLWPGGRAGNKNYIIDKIRLFQKLNAQSKAFATSISAESSNNWGPNGRGYYLASKLMWNPQLDPEEVLQDFYDKAFGPASDEMKKFYDFQDNVPPMRTLSVVGEVFRRFQAARIAAKGHPDVMKRLDDIGAYLHYYDLNARPSADAARTLEIQTLMYRNRYSYMDHWEAFRQDNIREDYNPTAPKPWKVDVPITHEEVENWINDAVKFYPDEKIPEQVKFSREVVPVNLSPENGGGETKDWVGPTNQAGSPTWVLYSIHGEPIRASIYSYNVYGGEKLSYELRDEKGAILAEGKPVGSTGKGTETELNVEVPGPGRYYLTYTDGSGSMYSLKIPAGQPFAFDYATIASSTLYGSTPDLYFYVPKGAKTIEYFFMITDYSNSGPHSVIAPDGSVQKTVGNGGSNSFISVPVPPGMDGQAWHFTSPSAEAGGGQFGLGRFHFFNCPDFLSVSSAQLLVPQELVEKDGLTLAE